MWCRLHDLGFSFPDIVLLIRCCVCGWAFRLKDLVHLQVLPVSWIDLDNLSNCLTRQISYRPVFHATRLLKSVQRVRVPSGWVMLLKVNSEQSGSSRGVSWVIRLPSSTRSLFMEVSHSAEWPILGQILVEVLGLRTRVPVRFLDPRLGTSFRQNKSDQSQEHVPAFPSLFRLDCSLVSSHLLVTQQAGSHYLFMPSLPCRQCTAFFLCHRNVG